MTSTVQPPDLLAGSPYLSYTYAYPHKTAYRTLQPAVPLRDAWAFEIIVSPTR